MMAGQVVSCRAWGQNLDVYVLALVQCAAQTRAFVVLNLWRMWLNCRCTPRQVFGHQCADDRGASMAALCGGSILGVAECAIAGRTPRFAVCDERPLCRTTPFGALG